MSHAQAISPVNELTDYLNAMRTMKANFIQITYDNHHKPIQQSYGQMALHRPGQFRWQVIKPIPQLIIANKSRLWIYDEDLEQVTIRSLKHAAGETPGLLLSHTNTNLNENFNITLSDKSSGTSGNRQWFLLTPKKSDNMFASIQLGFMKGHIQEMRLSDHLGHVTHIIFKNTVLNNLLPYSLFIFNPPVHVDVIDETK
jgi:outer membrane lipoprotein carrier protein